MSDEGSRPGGHHDEDLDVAAALVALIAVLSPADADSGAGRPGADDALGRWRARRLAALGRTRQPGGSPDVR